MKIAVNARFLLPGKLEGIGWYSHEILRRLVSAHPEDKFYFLFDRQPDTRFLYGPNVTSVQVFPPARHPFLWYWWFERSLPRVLHRLQPDVFFSPDGYASLCTNVPTVMTVHDLAYLHFPEQVPGLVGKFYRHYVPKYLQKVQHITAVSEATALDIKKHFSIAENKITVAPNAARPVFQPLSDQEKTAVLQQWTQGRPFYLYYGAIHPRKNVHRLIQAFDIFKKQTGAPHYLVLAGRMAWHTEAVQQAIQSASHAAQIVLTGYQDDARLARLAGSAFALVYPSLFEGFGLPVLEAMHCDVPVITSDTSSLPEVAGGAALLVNPHETASISDAMIRLWQEPEIYRELVLKGKTARQRYSWEDTADVVYAALRGAAAKK